MGQRKRARKRPAAPGRASAKASAKGSKGSTPAPTSPTPIPHKGGRQSKLTPEVEATVLDLIRKGCFATVAVAAAGCGYTSYKRWMNRTDRRARAFQRGVEKARAEARASREAAVFEGDPLAWLRLGPGRDNGPDEPGWTERPAPASRVEHTGPGGGPIAHAVTAQAISPVKVLLDPEARRLACDLLELVSRNDPHDAPDAGGDRGDRDAGDPAGDRSPGRGAAGARSDAHGGGDARAALAGGAGALRLEGALEARAAPRPAEPGAP